MLNAAQDYNSRKKALEDARAGQEEPGSVNSDVSAQADRNPENIEKAVSEVGRSQSEKNGQEKAKKTLNPFAVFGQASILKDMPYVCAIMVSVLKQILDIIFSATFILPMLFSLLEMIFNFMMMKLAEFSDTVKVRSRFTIKLVLLLLGCIFDSIPGLSFLPLSTATILIVYGITLWERANAKNKVQKN